MANPAERPMIMANMKNMPMTENKNKGRLPERSTLMEEMVATMRLKMAIWDDHCQYKNKDRSGYPI